eukprot:10125009-Alexandrium_andersonii.AAC.1
MRLRPQQAKRTTHPRERARGSAEVGDPMSSAWPLELQLTGPPGPPVPSPGEGIFAMWACWGRSL